MLPRYVEANPLKAKPADKAEAWRWCSLWRRVSGTREQRTVLAKWPVPRPRDWLALVNRPPPDEEAARVRQSLERSKPLGSDAWTARTAARLGLAWTLRPRGRPPKPRAKVPQ